MNVKLFVRIVFVILAANIRFLSYGQYSDLQVCEVVRDLQLNGKLNPRFSFCVRPLYNLSISDSLNEQDLTKGIPAVLAQSSKQVLFLPFELKQQYNTHHPYGWNDGSMIPAKGYQTQLSFGIYSKKSFFSLQLRPEIVFAQNRSFPVFPSLQNDTIWRSYYTNVLNKIDAPERFGTKAYLKIFPGQSTFRLNYHKISLGISTENLWWGPGVRNSLAMSDNAPGFAHLSFNSLQPITSPVGSFEWQLISGKLKGSGILPDTMRKFNGQSLYIPKPNGDRYLNGMVLTWQPRWTKGLFLGFSRVFYQYMSDVPSSFNGYLPVFGKFFKGSLSDEDEKKRDQVMSIFFRFMLPGERAELYAEYGRNDHSQNSRDFLLEPEHSRAYILGFSKTFTAPKKDVRLFAEITNLQIPSTILLRAQESWYAHYQVRHGYTNYGQVIGTGIGPGGSSQTIGLQWGSGFNTFGGTIERVVHNNDFYYNAFAASEQWQKHWVDVSLNLKKSWIRKRLIYSAELAIIHSLNYEWYYDDINNVSARVGISYLF